MNFKRRWARAASVAAVSTGLVLGVGGAVPFASASTDPSIDSCVNFVHTNHWYARTQTVVGTNRCATGTYEFQIGDWYPAAISWEYSPCFSVGPGQSAGWKWPRGRDYYIRAC